MITTMIDSELYKILEHQKKQIRDAYRSDELGFLIIEIIRSLDHAMFMLKHDIKVPQKEWLIEKYRSGWGKAFTIYYSDYKPDDIIPMIVFDPDMRRWLDNMIQHAGKVQISSQFLGYCKAGLMELTRPSTKEFIFTYTINDATEYYEKLSLAFYFQIVNKALENKIAKLKEELPSVRNKLEAIVSVANGKFISYKATDEIDDFYSRFGRLYLQTTQIIDEFDEKDVFGGIPYKMYLDLTEDIIMAAIMHRDCCMVLVEKTNHKIFLRDILTYTFPKDLFIKNYSESRTLNEDNVIQMTSCLTINKENFEEHLSYPGAPCPLFFELAENVLMRSSHGCLDMPVFFLNRELKRRYPRDYFNAVNNREKRFKDQLYSLFPEKIIKTNENVVIKIDNKSTDIDAIIFDPKKKSLGLFQLKWQDTFSTSMKERFSRMSNLVPKSVEWIDKVEAWLQANGAKQILEKLNIKNEDEIHDIHLFVLSRNHVHFSNQQLDKRAIWASWFQVIEASAKVKDPHQTDPIGEFAAKLQFFSPSMRKDLENDHAIQNSDFKIANYNISIRSSK